MDSTIDGGQSRRSRLLPGLASITQSIRDVVVAVTEPLSPSCSEFSFTSAPSTPVLEKLRRLSTNRKSVDDGSPSRGL